MTKYDMTIEIKDTDGRNEMRDIVVPATTIDTAIIAARKLGRVVRVHGVHGTTVAFDGSLSSGDLLDC